MWNNTSSSCDPPFLSDTSHCLNGDRPNSQASFTHLLSPSLRQKLTSSSELIIQNNPKAVIDTFAFLSMSFALQKVHCNAPKDVPDQQILPVKNIKRFPTMIFTSFVLFEIFFCIFSSQFHSLWCLTVR